MKSKPCVYIVDDNDSFRQSVAFMLGGSRYSIKQFDCAEAVVETLHTLSDEDNVCMLLDVRMPGLSGLDLHDQLNTSQPDLPVIYMTGHADVPLAVEAMKKGAVTLLEKPLDPVELKNAVDVALSECASKRERAADEQAGGSVGVSTQPRSEQAQEFQQALDGLTPRETEVLEHLVQGMANKACAYSLDISVRTVEMHRARLLKKLHVRSGAELIRAVLMHRAGQ